MVISWCRDDVHLHYRSINVVSFPTTMVLQWCLSRYRGISTDYRSIIPLPCSCLPGLCWEWLCVVMYCLLLWLAVMLLLLLLCLQPTFYSNIEVWSLLAAHISLTCHTVNSVITPLSLSIVLPFSSLKYLACASLHIFVFFCHSMYWVMQKTVEHTCNFFLHHPVECRLASLYSSSTDVSSRAASHKWI